MLLIIASLANLILHTKFGYYTPDEWITTHGGLAAVSCSFLAAGVAFLFLVIELITLRRAQGICVANGDAVESQTGLGLLVGSLFLGAIGAGVAAGVFRSLYAKELLLYSEYYADKLYARYMSALYATYGLCVALAVFMWSHALSLWRSSSKAHIHDKARFRPISGPCCRTNNPVDFESTRLPHLTALHHHSWTRSLFHYRIWS